MKKNRFLKGVAILSILLFSITSTGITFAASKSDIEKQQKELDNQIKETKDNLNQVQNEKNDTLDEITEITKKISDYESEISSLSSEIDTLTNSIQESEQKITDATAEYEKQSDLLGKRLVTIYESGQTTYLDVLLSSKSLTDFISKFYLVTQLANYDTELIESINEQKQAIEQEKLALETNKQKVESAKTNKELKSQELEATKSEKNKKVASLSEDEKTMQKQLEQFEQDKAALEDELTEIFNKNNSGNSSSGNNGSSGGSSGGSVNNPVKPSSSGYINPVSGYSIHCGFGDYAGHTGADFSGSGIYGKPVLAVKAGTVVKAKVTTGDIPNYDLNGNLIGYYRSYGVYVVIDHHDGTMTLYAHGKPNSLLVSVGQEVKQGQQIMSVGNTGNVRPRPTPSNPTAGAHLHFEVQIMKNGKATAVDPAPYLP